MGISQSQMSAENTDAEPSAAPFLLPCPFCGADPDEIGMHEKEEGWNMVCYVCHVETAYCETDTEALAVWNKRVSPPQVVWRSIFIDEPPKGKDGEAPISLLLSWTYVAENGKVADRLVGEGYWAANEDGTGDWWWANTAPGDYYHDPIRDSITGQITHWAHMPSAPAADSPGTQS